MNETSDDIEQAREALRAEFPAWSIIRTTDTGRWWATRGPLVREDLNEQASADADTPEGLRAEIQRIVQRPAARAAR